MRADRQKRIFEALPPTVQLLARRLQKGSVTFPPAVFADCLSPEDLAVLKDGRTPIARVETVVLPPDGIWTLRIRCPNCGSSHRHGGGDLPLPYFGTRYPHCDGPVYALDPRIP